MNWLAQGGRYRRPLWLHKGWFPRTKVKRSTIFHISMVFSDICIIEEPSTFRSWCSCWTFHLSDPADQHICHLLHDSAAGPFSAAMRTEKGWGSHKRVLKRPQISALNNIKPQNIPIDEELFENTFLWNVYRSQNIHQQSHRVIWVVSEQSDSGRFKKARRSVCRAALTSRLIAVNGSHMLERRKRRYAELQGRRLS